MAGLILCKGVNRVSSEHVSDETDGRDFIVICLPIHPQPERKTGKSKKGNNFTLDEATPSIFGHVEVIADKAFNVSASVSKFVNEL